MFFFLLHPLSAIGFSLFGAWDDVFHIICHNQSHSLQSDQSVKMKIRCWIPPCAFSLRIFHIVYYVNMFIQYYHFSIRYLVEFSFFFRSLPILIDSGNIMELPKWLNIRLSPLIKYISSSISVVWANGDNDNQKTQQPSNKIKIIILCYCEQWFWLITIKYEIKKNK